jgi:hypothetical protein
MEDPATSGNIDCEPIVNACRNPDNDLFDAPEQTK